jgi:hypothetical protein
MIYFIFFLKKSQILVKNVTTLFVGTAMMEQFFGTKNNRVNDRRKQQVSFFFEYPVLLYMYY